MHFLHICKQPRHNGIRRGRGYTHTYRAISYTTHSFLAFLLSPQLQIVLFNFTKNVIYSAASFKFLGRIFCKLFFARKLVVFGCWSILGKVYSSRISALLSSFILSSLCSSAFSSSWSYVSLSPCEAISLHSSMSFFVSFDVI